MNQFNDHCINHKYSVSSTKKRPFIGGNWKCNGTLTSIDSLISELNSNVTVSSIPEIVIAVPALHILHTKAILNPGGFVAAQDVGVNGNGSYTGEHSAEMLVDAGIMWTIIGHSERRQGFGVKGETSILVATKAKRAIDNGMKVIVCIGENLEDRQNGNMNDVLRNMLEPLFDTLNECDWVNVVIAYEPVWAIGTGVTATPEQAEDTHLLIRKLISSRVSLNVATNLRIIYGGSVKKNNCENLIKCMNIDGFLVGGASLLPEFSYIINCLQL